MIVTVYSLHALTCQKLMDEYCHVFSQKPDDDAKDGSQIWYQFPDDTLRLYWEEWIKAALRVGLIYEGDVK